MKLTIEKKSLLLMTQRVQGRHGDKNFSFIGLKACSEGVLMMNGRDRVISVYCEERCLVDRKGLCFVKARLFSDVVKELPEAQIELCVTDSQLVLRANDKFDCTIKLPILDDTQWLDEKTFIGSATTVTPPSAKIAYLIEQVQFCINQESPRNYATVGYLHSKDSKTLCLVGTDGFRLSMCEIGYSLPTDFLKYGICISKRGLSEILRMSSEGCEVISLLLSDDRKTISAQIEGYRIYVQLSSVNFPKYQSVIPKNGEQEVSLDRSLLQRVMKRVLLAADKNRTLKLNMAEQMLTLSSQNFGNSEGKEKIFVEGAAESSANLSINGKYLSDVVSSTNSGKINIKFRDDENPILVTPVTEPSDCRSQHVLVPIKESH